MTKLCNLSFEDFVQKIVKIKTFVDMHYQEDSDPLAILFKIEPEEEEIIRIPELDNAIEEHLYQLSSQSLVDIFCFTLKDVYHNYQSCLTVLNEIIRRNDESAQLEVVSLFINACQFCEPGHRFYTDTVFDSLITKEFHLLNSKSIYTLLSQVSYDRLKSDELDQLFVPAIKNTKDLELQKKF